LATANQLVAVGLGALQADVVDADGRAGVTAAVRRAAAAIATVATVASIATGTAAGVASVTSVGATAGRAGTAGEHCNERRNEQQAHGLHEAAGLTRP